MQCSDYSFTVFRLQNILYSELCKALVWRISARAFTRFQKIVQCGCSLLEVEDDLSVTHVILVIFKIRTIHFIKRIQRIFAKNREYGGILEKTWCMNV